MNDDDMEKARVSMSEGGAVKGTTLPPTLRTLLSGQVRF